MATVVEVKLTKWGKQALLGEISGQRVVLGCLGITSMLYSLQCCSCRGGALIGRLKGYKQTKRKVKLMNVPQKKSRLSKLNLESRSHRWRLYLFIALTYIVLAGSIWFGLQSLALLLPILFMIGILTRQPFQVVSFFMSIVYSRVEDLVNL